MLLTTIVLTPLFCALSLATITLEELPSKLRAGSEYHIKWTQDRDYVSDHPIIIPTPSPVHEVPILISSPCATQRLWNLDLTHSEDNGEWFSHVCVVDHMLDFKTGENEIYWKVPAVRDDGLVLHQPTLSTPNGTCRYQNRTSMLTSWRNYRLSVRGMPVGPPEEDEWLPGTPAYAYSNTFRVVGGPTLYRRDIAVVTAGTLGVMVLVIGTAVVGVKVWRRKRGERAVAL
jgi:hypothetical protein